MDNLKAHWEKVYETKTPQEVSWTQDKPQTSLDLIHQSGLGKSARIIDIGGGDSKLVDFLIDEGYENITVLDISAKALERAQTRLGNKAAKVIWIVSDITSFVPAQDFDIWHDRAAFHFLTTDEQIDTYVQLVKKHVRKFLSIGTFSTNGPEKCSGLYIKRYDETSLTKLFEPEFSVINCKTEDHLTPFNTTQNFIFCAMERNS
ncbi:class I SAM-dependent methyltransferase [Pseudoflavitalea rhizosphaerae]|uniref:class I SAM-dependent methyltransferase n=1 Tax=Pseudoflavitalea rhizosphaerae TaxID=1884793 RepID=UPI000F8F3FA6|nr:class I SAM-dependent methyltransferase [Pseudoflavitalea rhizosphaerae]